MPPGGNQWVLTLVPMTSHITLEQFTGAHFQELAMHVLESTPRRGRRSLKQKKRSINELDDDELRKRKKTFNSLVSILRGAFQIAWDNGNLESDRPLRCLKRLPNVDRPRTIYLSRDECRRLISASGPDLKVLVRAALYSGCRIRELTALRVRDVLMGQKCIFISFPKGHRARHVFLPTEGTHFFESIAAGRHSGDVLFRKQNGRAWGGEYKDYFRAARDRANLPQLLTFHGLRHTYASQLIENGAPHAVVAAQLGHVDIRTVCSTYGHLTSSLREREVQRHSENIDGCGTKPQHAPTTTPLQQRLLPDPVVSWPRCNFSTYSGPLLGVLKPKCDF